MPAAQLAAERDLDELSADDVLAAAEQCVTRRREAEVHDLRIVAAWAALHSTDPRRDPDSGRRVWAEDRLLQLGGEGTPGVREFCLAELAMARQVHPVACQRAVADVLDLQHRLPRIWRRVELLECEVWLARKVAHLSRRLPMGSVGVVDLAVSAALGGDSPGRVLRIAEAKVIEADPETHRSRVAAERRRRHVSLSRTDEHGLRHIVARVAAGDAVWVDAMVERVADLIADQHPGSIRDEVRSIALGWLARPAEVLQLLLENQQGEEVSRATAFPADLLETLRTVRPERLRPRVSLYVHLSQLALEGRATLVARIEGVGPVLADHELFARCAVTVKPVIDLNDRVDLNCYEHPTWLRERRLLITPADCFPYAAAVPGQAGRSDLDHPTPYDDSGPPGQTGLHNSGPLGRRHHRWKTHGGYVPRQSGMARWIWRSPQGRHYLVDHTGTRPLDRELGDLIMGAPAGVEVYPTALVATS